MCQPVSARGSGLVKGQERGVSRGPSSRVTDDNCARFAPIPASGATAHRPKGLKVPCSAAELPARLQSPDFTG